MPIDKDVQLEFLDSPFQLFEPFMRAQVILCNFSINTFNSPVTIVYWVDNFPFWAKILIDISATN